MQTQQCPTLRQIRCDYFYSRDLSASTLRWFGLIDRFLMDWMEYPANEITKDMIKDRHRQIRKKTPVQANSVFRQLRTLYNFARDEYEADGQALVTLNPVRVLSTHKLWCDEGHEKTHIPIHLLRDWFLAVLALPDRNDVIRDYLVLSLLNGFRKEEVSSLEWSGVDFRGEYLTAFRTKNGKDHVLPMSKFTSGLLAARYEKRKPHATYVLPGRRSVPYLQDPYKAFERIEEETGIASSPHALRRTFLLISDELDHPFHIQQRMLNHTPQTVTHKHYKIDNPNKLRPYMEAITQYVLDLAGMSDQHVAS